MSRWSKNLAFYVLSRSVTYSGNWCSRTHPEQRYTSSSMSIYGCGLLPSTALEAYLLYLLTYSNQGKDDSKSGEDRQGKTLEKSFGLDLKGSSCCISPSAVTRVIQAASALDHLKWNSIMDIL